uniref:Uncharacterized protein n=1 Tax=Triticum urartu TaxID=4572 RepID=A0A8R7QEY8_TRIUA
RAFPHGGIIPIRKEKSSRFEILSLGLGDLLGDDASLWQDPLVPCWAGERRAASDAVNSSPAVVSGQACESPSVSGRAGEWRSGQGQRAALLIRLRPTMPVLRAFPIDVILDLIPRFSGGSKDICRFQQQKRLLFGVVVVH